MKDSNRLLLTNLLAMGSNIGLKIIISLFTVSIIAKSLGAEKFGLMALYLASSNILILVCNYGLNTYLMKELPRITHWKPKVSTAFSFKVILSILIVITSNVIMVPIKIDEPLAFNFLLLSLVIESFISFLQTCLRTKGEFKFDFNFSLFYSFFLFAVIFVFISLYPTLISIAVAYFIARVIVLIWLLQFFRKLVCHVEIKFSIALNSWFKRSKYYALDLGLSSLFGNVDSIILNSKFSLDIVGYYQAGMRLVLTTIQGAAVFNNVFMPKASKSYGNNEFKNDALLLQMSFIIVSLLIFVVYAFFSDVFVEFVFGSDFAYLIEIMPYFSVLIVARYLVASIGIILTIVGEQKFRTLSNATIYAAIIIFALLSPSINMLSDWLVLMILLNVLLFGVYYLRILHVGLFDYRVFAAQLFVISMLYAVVVR